MRYFKLIDKINYNEIIKDDKDYSYCYYFGAETWVKTGIMIRYQWPDDDLFGEYTEVSEEEAMELIDIQRKKLNKLYDLAKKVAAKAHEGQVDKGGNPYINHPVAVADALESTEHKIVALLHDILEDTNITVEKLREYGFTDRIIKSIRILTKDDNVSYDDYMSTIKRDSNASKVKRADIKHNMDMSRITNPTEKDMQRLEKYKKALQFLEN